MSLLEIDGSYGEGGGQIIRTALALSTITGIPIRVFNIRNGRKTPGLKHQHLKSIEALKEICGAETNEIALKSEELIYTPGIIQSKDLEFDIVTSGSICLFLQPLLLPLCFGSKSCTIKVKGGTSGKGAMPYEYFDDILLPHLQKFCEIESTLLRRGYFPKGGGEVEIRFMPKFRLKDFPDFDSFKKHVVEEVPDISLLEVGELSHISGVSHASKELQSKKISERQADSAKVYLKDLGVSVMMRSEYSETYSTGTGMELDAVFSKDDEIDPINPVRLGANSLGDRGKSAEVVGKEASSNLRKEIEAALSSNAPVDAHLADNLIKWLIFGGKFRTTTVTEHTRTNAWVVNKFFPGLIKMDGNRIYAP
jgi:RNA 3'-phosphate cyclase